MKRYFLFALIVASASVTSISAFAVCPMEAARAKQAARQGQGEIVAQEILPQEQVAGSTPSHTGPQGFVAPTRSAPSMPPMNPH